MRPNTLRQTILFVKGRMLPHKGYQTICQLMNPLNLLIGNASYFIISLCLMPDDFTHQGKSAATQWVNQTIC
jgi:hypothetical protein